LWASEAVLLALVGKGLGRQEAYVLVQRNAMRAWRAEGTFLALLGADADIGVRLTATELAACFDLEHALRHADALIDRALASVATRDERA
jgi:adenylosuccinate lyase